MLGLSLFLCQRMGSLFPSDNVLNAFIVSLVCVCCLLSGLLRKYVGSIFSMQRGHLMRSESECKLKSVETAG